MLVNVEDWWLKTLEDNIKFYKQQVFKINEQFDKYKREARAFMRVQELELHDLRKSENAYKRFQSKRRKMVEYQHSLEAKITRQKARIKELEDKIYDLQIEYDEMEEYYSDYIDMLMEDIC